VPAVKAAEHYFQEVNAKGGVHGRKIRYVVEDHGYNVSKVGPAINKLVNRDKIFASLLSLGTPHNLAAFKIMDPKGIPNVNPLSAARQMLQEPLASHYAGTSSYYDQIRTAVEYMKANAGATTVCAMYLPTDFGKDIQSGAKDGAAASGLKYAAETTHKGDDADFVGSLSKLKAEGCDLVAMALGVRQTLTVLGTAKKMGLSGMNFLGSSASFHTVIAKAGEGKPADGFYAAAGWQDVEARMGDPELAAWVKSFSDAAGAKLMGTGAMLGRSAAELFVRGVEAAGKDLTQESFRSGMESLEYEDHILGNKVKLGPGDHLAADAIYISKVEGGSWKTLVTIEQ
jgi:branched-chain amino acid transport system substrate-binding protein